jgi:hypothetical protein
MNWIHYLLESNLYLAAFYALYYLIFRGETHYQLNRIYLLVSTALAFIIPVIQIGLLNPPAKQLQNVVITIINLPTTSTVKAVVADTSWPVVNYFILAYGAIVFLLLFNLFVKIYKLIRLSHTNKNTEQEGFKLVELTVENNAFSFFNYLFISQGLTHSSTIIRHELVHIRQKHSWDIIYLELLKIINWFNPVVYLVQYSMKELHEFIADNQTVNTDQNTAVYTDFLVNNAYGINENILTNTFFNKSLLKKRIMMLHQKKSGNAARLKYLLVLPLAGGLLCVSTLAFAKSYGWIDIVPKYYSPEKSSIINDGQTKTKLLKATKGDNSIDSAIRKEITEARAKSHKAASKTTDTSQTPPPVSVGKKQSPKSAVKFLPPGFWNDDLTKLGDYIQRHLRYPAVARDNNVYGNILAQFTVNSDHKITDIKIIKGIEQACDNELIRTLKSYKGNVDKHAGDYLFITAFHIIRDNKANNSDSEPIDPQLYKKTNFVGLVQIATYIR